MKQITIISIFPEFLNHFKNYSLIKKWQDNNLLNLNIVNLRDFSTNKSKQVDDYPFGGSKGMILMIEPIVKAIKKYKSLKTKVILLTPSGKTLHQDFVFELSKENDFIFICGHYEGIDHRIYNYIDLEISIGDYIISSGELAAMILLEAIMRVSKNAIKQNSYLNDSFSNQAKILDFASYTKPRVFENHSVPKVLISGNHLKIKHWQLESSLKLTLKKRPDLLKNANLTNQQKLILNNLIKNKDLKKDNGKIQK